MKIQNDKFLVSYYDSKFSRIPKQVDLFQILLTQQFKYLTDELRSYEYHSEKYDEFKLTKMPIILGNGICQYGQQKTAENIRINPTIIIDVDLEDNPTLIDKYTLSDWKCEFMNQDDAILAITSCGGRGIMILHRLSDSVTKETYIKYFKKLERRYKEKYGIVIDDSCKNVNRLRYVTFDDDYYVNEIYNALELTEEDLQENNKESKQEQNYNTNTNIVFNYTSDTFDLDNSKGPFYFGHSSRHPQKIDGTEIKVPLISETIHTLLCLYDKETVKEIWKHPKFYSKDSSDNIRWIDNYKVADENGNIVPVNEWKPNIKVIKFLNDYCGFNIEYDIKRKNDIELVDDTDFISGIIGKKYDIELKDNEYMYDRKDDILKYLSSSHINMINCPPGRGKTTFFNKLYINENKRMCVIQPYKSIVNSKYKGINCHLCVEKQKIQPEFEYVITHYDNFCHAYEHNQLGNYDYIVIDESHLLGTQTFRSNIMLKTIKYVEQYNEDNPNVKIVLMTGTPTNETALFKNIDTFIDIKFNDNKFVGIQYMNAQTYKSTKIEENKNHTKYEVDIYNNDVIKTLVYLSNIAKNEGRKVYVYWGTGSISNDEIYQQAAQALNSLNIAVYHKRNEGNKDLNDIRENECIGEYDGLMSSCYFSVGCDLNDEQPAQIIIIGNNTYQEDAQVIGRFRKSKNIKVTILVNSYNIPKYDCDKELEAEIMKITQLSKSRNSKNTSLVTKLTTDEDIEKKAYITVSQKYYSDIKRKFEYYKNMNWFMFNNYNLVDDHYEMTDLEGNSILYLIDMETNIVNEIKKIRQSRIQETKESIWHNIKIDPNFDLTEEYNMCTKYPNLQDWIDAVRIFQKYYDISELFSLSPDIIYNLSKKRLNTLLRWSLSYKDNDGVENYIIEKILENKDILNELRKDNEIEYIKKIGLYYVMWCSAYDNSQEFTFCTYDLNNKWAYPVYKQWKDNIESILNVDDVIRNILMKENYKEIVIDEFTKEFFNIQEDTNKAFEYVKNKFVNNYDKIRFVEFICRQKTKAEKQGAKLKTITEKFKKPEKYNLKIGQEFPSFSALAAYTGKSNKTVSQWVKKQWVI